MECIRLFQFPPSKTPLESLLESDLLSYRCVTFSEVIRHPNVIKENNNIKNAYYKYLRTCNMNNKIQLT